MRLCRVLQVGIRSGRLGGYQIIRGEKNLSGFYLSVLSTSEVDNLALGKDPPSPCRIQILRGKLNHSGGKAFHDNVLSLTPGPHHVPHPPPSTTPDPVLSRADVRVQYVDFLRIPVVFLRRVYSPAGGGPHGPHLAGGVHPRGAAHLRADQRGHPLFRRPLGPDGVGVSRGDGGTG